MMILAAVAVACALAFVCCGGEGSKEDPDDGQEEGQVVPAPKPISVAFARGADISWVSEMERDMKASGKSLSGFSFKDSKGNSDIFAILKGLGMNAVRLRVWVAPLDKDGWSGKDDMVKLAKRAFEAGLAVMVDFHYSDFFSDPSYQDTPSSWASRSGDAVKMADAVSSYTKEVLNALKTAGVAPTWVQTGNETRSGMIWPTGKLDWSASGRSASWARFAQLVNAGYTAAKSVFPDVVVICHLNHAYEDNAWWFKEFKAAGGKFDMIGLSHYPMSDDPSKTWSTMNTLAQSSVKSLASQFSCKVMVVEYGVKPSDSSSGKCTEAFLSSMKSSSTACAGVFYWEPEVDGQWKPAVYSSSVPKHGRAEAWNAYGQGAFKRSGKTLSPDQSILGAFGE